MASIKHALGWRHAFALILQLTHTLARIISSIYLCACTYSIIYGTVSSKITLLEIKFYHYKNCTLRKATYLHNGFIFSFLFSYTCSHISSLCANRFWCSRYLPCHGYKGLQPNGLRFHISPDTSDDNMSNLECS